MDAHGLPIRALITDGTTADCTQATALLSGFQPTYLIADRGYDTNDIIAQAHQAGIEPVIPSTRKRTTARPYDHTLYAVRYRVENTFLHLKQWRGIATRYAKNAHSFLAAIHIRCFMLRLAKLI